MFQKRLASFLAGVFAIIVSLVPAYAGDDSIIGPVFWLLLGSGVLILLVVVLTIMGKKGK